MMRPENFRKLLIKPGSSVGLFGDGGDSDNWTDNRVVLGVLQRYLLVRRSAWNHHEDVWDAGALVELNIPLKTRGYSRGIFEGSYLFIMLHDPNKQYDSNDASVHVLGIKDKRLLVANLIEKRFWEPGTERLAYRALFIDMVNPGEVARKLLAKQG
jgi:hypothetical protein